MKLFPNGQVLGWLSDALHDHFRDRHYFFADAPYYVFNLNEDPFVAYYRMIGHRRDILFHGRGWLMLVSVNTDYIEKCFRGDKSRAEQDLMAFKLLATRSA